jgi:hypothetical protein
VIQCFLSSGKIVDIVSLSNPVQSLFLYLKQDFNRFSYSLYNILETDGVNEICNAQRHLNRFDFIPGSEVNPPWVSKFQKFSGSKLNQKTITLSNALYFLSPVLYQTYQNYINSYPISPKLNNLRLECFICRKNVKSFLALMNHLFDGCCSIETKSFFISKGDETNICRICQSRLALNSCPNHLATRHPVNILKLIEPTLDPFMQKDLFQEMVLIVKRVDPFFAEGIINFQSHSKISLKTSSQVPENLPSMPLPQTYSLQDQTPQIPPQSVSQLTNRPCDKHFQCSLPLQSALSSSNSLSQPDVTPDEKTLYCPNENKNQPHIKIARQFLPPNPFSLLSNQDIIHEVQTPELIPQKKEFDLRIYNLDGIEYIDSNISVSICNQKIIYVHEKFNIHSPNLVNLVKLLFK